MKKYITFSLRFVEAKHFYFSGGLYKLTQHNYSKRSCSGKYQLQKNITANN